MKITEISKVLGQLWREMDESAKKPFNKKAAADKERQVMHLHAVKEVHYVERLSCDPNTAPSRLPAVLSVPPCTTAFLSLVYPTCPTRERGITPPVFMTAPAFSEMTARDVGETDCTSHAWGTRSLLMISYTCRCEAFSSVPYTSMGRGTRSGGELPHALCTVLLFTAVRAVQVLS